MGYLVFTAIMVAWLIWAVRWVRAHRKATGILARSSILKVILDCEHEAAAKEGREPCFPMTLEQMYAWRDGKSLRITVPESFDRSRVTV